MVRLSRLLADKDVKSHVPRIPYQLGNSLLGNPLTNEWETQQTNKQNKQILI
jgi:hypothetical protein